jgi:hypothetical protein
MAAAGFGIAAVSGAGLLATKATEYIGNPFLYIKIPVIGLGLLNVFLVHRSSAWRAHKNRDLRYTERQVMGAIGDCFAVRRTMAARRRRVRCERSDNRFRAGLLGLAGPHRQ